MSGFLLNILRKGAGLVPPLASVTAPTFSVGLTAEEPGLEEEDSLAVAPTAPPPLMGPLLEGGRPAQVPYPPLRRALESDAPRSASEAATSSRPEPSGPERPEAPDADPAARPAPAFALALDASREPPMPPSGPAPSEPEGQGGPVRSLWGPLRRTTEDSARTPVSPEPALSGTPPAHPRSAVPDDATSPNSWNMWVGPTRDTEALSASEMMAEFESSERPQGGLHAMPAPSAPEPPPDAATRRQVQVRIGRVEVRIDRSADAPSPEPPERGFGDYARTRSYRDRRWY